MVTTCSPRPMRPSSRPGCGLITCTASWRRWTRRRGPTGDLDSTICETYGLAKEGAHDHGYTGQRGYHPLLAVAAFSVPVGDAAVIAEVAKRAHWEPGVGCTRGRRWVGRAGAASGSVRKGRVGGLRHSGGAVHPVGYRRPGIFGYGLDEICAG